MVNTISLMTDFGYCDQYVGVMKSVIINHNPSVSLIDITHGIEPQNLSQAKFLTKCSYDYFPKKSVHIIVVDPDVGTDRNILIAETPNAFFIAPDNGVLSEIVKPYVNKTPLGNESFVTPSDLCKLYVLDQPQYWNDSVSNTFHGRDIFAPVGGLLAKNRDPKIFGTHVKQMIYDPIVSPILSIECIEGEIVYVDRFGNLISNIESTQIDYTKDLTIGVEGIVIDKLGDTFKQPNVHGDLVALIGSHGYLEVALYQANASNETNIGEGSKITVQYR